MKRKSLAKTLKGIVLFILLLAAAFYTGLFPSVIKNLLLDSPGAASYLTPCMIGAAVSAIPVLIALIAFWMICTDISNDCSFSGNNVKRLSIIGFCALTDTVYCFLYTLLLFILSVFDPGILFLSLGIILIGLAISIASFLLSHLVEKARAMEEEIQFTV